MCWKCDAVRQARGWDRGDPGGVFEITDAMLLDYAQRHGVSYDQAEDAFIFAAGGIQPSRAWH